MLVKAIDGASRAAAAALVALPLLWRSAVPALVEPPAAPAPPSGGAAAAPGVGTRAGP
jgi:hypothetical protein